jgi:hypothetical protein
MTNLQTQKHPQPKDVIDVSKKSPSKLVTMPAAPSQEKIRERAYELYERRGRKSGQDEQDWLCAEQEIVERAG